MRIPCYISLVVAMLLGIAVMGIGAIGAQRGQELSSEARSQEIVADQATGRVYILVVKDAIVVGALGIPTELGALPPEIVRMESSRMAVLLGGVDWRAIDSGQPLLASLARELPSLRPQSAAGAPPHLQQESNGGVAADIEIVGVGVFDRLRGIAAQLHGAIHLPDAQPVLKIVLADFVEDYGPEVWTLDYDLRQEELRADYWQTQIDRPRYQQLWPPDKGEKHSPVEISYPGSARSQPLLSELLHDDPRLKNIGGAGPAFADVQQAILAGDTRKLLPADAIAFMRAVLSALAGNDSDNYAIAAIGEHTGFSWIVRPKASVDEKKERPPGAPTLGRP
jgi:hypothetical protein